MTYQRFEVIANGLKYRGVYGFDGALPENMQEILTCVLKNLKGSVAVICSSSDKALEELKKASDISHFLIEDVSPVREIKKQVTQVQSAENTDTPKTWKCECGKENSDNFCIYCGRKQATRPESCPDCGKKLVPEANFCGNCGRKI